MKEAEKHNYHYLLVKYRNDMGKLLGVIKSVINKDQKLHIQGRFEIGEKIITFNNVLINIGPTLAKLIPRLISKYLLVISAMVQLNPYTRPHGMEMKSAIDNIVKIYGCTILKIYVP